MCKYHPHRKDTDRIPEPTPFCAPPCKKTIQKTTHLPKHSHEPIFEGGIFTKNNPSKNQNPTEHQKLQHAFKNCNLQPFHPLHFPRNFGGTTFLPGGNHKQSYPEPWRCQLLSVTTGGPGWLPLEPLLKKNLILPGP